jgi:hypothetical protein
MTRTRVLVFLGLLVVGGGTAYWYSSSAAPSSVPGSVNSGGRSARGGRGTEVPDIRLESLERERAAMRGPERNPFQFERRAAAEDAPRQTVRRVVPTEVIPVAPAPPPPPPPIPLRFIGFLQPKGAAGRVAVLSDGRGNVFNGKEGDIIEGRYRLLRVGNDSAELVYVDGRGRQTIRLSGQ